MCHLIKQLMIFHFGGHLFINPLEVMFTSAVGFGEHHFLGVDKSQCTPFEKSLIYIETICLLFCFDGWALALFVLTPCRFLHFRKYD
jgi:hypothetical protein